MIDLEGGTVEVYDSSSSSYTMSVRVLAQTSHLKYSVVLNH
ncbi:hypothetical protein PPTG_24361 [Phytophthora nicotianae INRA-310]|uniref:Uncharacterized protein n=1 Tax=Phytophthora nicotianae (strain INRA-310) TaxID=761204 RepID=W2PGA0_PHYN3|nr:hypothetical protein PPTG_24361 [Phytophthora nicotianae INRA-310]ETM99891.1 hypothetical protein PPTG_24361 [Phytophthora nicotianae INRA-310]